MPDQGVGSRQRHGALELGKGVHQGVDRFGQMVGVATLFVGEETVMLAILIPAVSYFLPIFKQMDLKTTFKRDKAGAKVGSKLLNATDSTQAVLMGNQDDLMGRLTQS